MATTAAPVVLKINVGENVICALSLDDPSMKKNHGVTVEDRGPRKYSIVGDPKGIASVLEDISSRGHQRGQEGWDQPDSWKYACKRAYDSAVKSLAAAGYQIKHVGFRIEVVPVDKAGA